mmetsp:Transcript_12450/g.31047  ORF Transcript_12450/g.31047 Transcript_12450/m.31047 type:complete len:98 (+) Transcript_12450:20-313(+)
MPLSYRDTGLVSHSVYSLDSSNCDAPPAFSYHVSSILIWVAIPNPLLLAYQHERRDETRTRPHVRHIDINSTEPSKTATWPTSGGTAFKTMPQTCVS